MKYPCKVLVLPDLQVRKARNGDPPGEDARTLRAVLKYAETQAPYDEIIQLGDWLDLPYWSRYDAGQTSMDDSLRYYEQDLATGLALLRRFGDLGKKLTVIQGNHDYRFEVMAGKYPNVGKLVLSPEEWLKAEGHNFVPYWRNKSLSYKIGKAEFIHGRYTNLYHAHKHSLEYLGSNVFYGHVHDIQSYSPVVRDRDHVPAAKSMGCLCRLDQPWLLGASTNWTQSFSQFYFMDNGKFTFYETRIFGNRFIGPDGKEYKG